MPYVMLAAAAISIIGSMQSAQDQAEAERKNAAFYREQQLFQQEATAREIAIFDRKSRQLKGDQLMSVSSRGLELSASSMELLASESVAMDNERYAIQREGEFKQRLAGLRAEQADQPAARTARGFRAAAAPRGRAARRVPLRRHRLDVARRARRARAERADADVHRRVRRGVVR